jgi:hypothetical protein
VVAVDGTKIAAAATHHATRTYEQIAKEILADAARVDAVEDELYGQERGDELPEGLRTSGDRRARLREAKQALEAERAAHAKPIPRDRDQRLQECRRRLTADWELERKVIDEHAAWLEAGIASDGSRRMAGARHNIKPYPLVARRAADGRSRDRSGASHAASRCGASTGSCGVTASSSRSTATAAMRCWVATCTTSATRSFAPTSSETRCARWISHARWPR